MPARRLRPAVAINTTETSCRFARRDRRQKARSHALRAQADLRFDSAFPLRLSEALRDHTSARKMPDPYRRE